MMLAKWLKLDPEASWNKLVLALEELSEEAVAAKIKRKFVDIKTTEVATTSDAATDVLSVATEIRSAATFSKLLLIMSHTCTLI